MCASLEQQHIPFDSLTYLDWHFMDVGWHAYQVGWGRWMQAGSVTWNQKFSWKWNLLFFKAVPPNLGSLLHIITPYSAILDYEITLNILEFILNSIKKVKPGFSFSLTCMFFWIECDKILISQLSHPKFRYFADQNGLNSGFSPLWKGGEGGRGRGGGGETGFLNSMKFLGNWNFSKLRGKEKRGRKEEFLKFSLGEGMGGIAGGETSNRKQNFKMNLKMFSWVI